MTELHRDGTSAAPRPPAGVVAVNVSFTPAVEAPRQEWFVLGTQHERVQGVPAAAALARIESPGNGTVIALDPDIPQAAQRVPIRARGAIGGLRFRLDEAVLGDARSAVLWPPRAGYHTLWLEDRAGRAVDRVHFTVR
jgi:penicillin-binding protein 1C